MISIIHLTYHLVFTNGVGYDLNPNNTEMFPKRELVFIQAMETLANMSTQS